MKTKKEVSKKPATKKKIATKVATKPKAASVKRTVKKVAVKKSATTSAKKKSPARNRTISATKKSMHIKAGKRRAFPSFKRMTYMVFSIILGILLGTFLHLFVELVYMRNTMASELRASYFLGMPSFLPMMVQPLFLSAGIAFGMWLGFWGWRFVYIEKRHRTTKNA